MDMGKLRRVASKERAAIIFTFCERSLEHHTESSVCVACGNRTITADHDCAYCGGDTDTRLFGEPAADRLQDRALQSAGATPDDPEIAMKLLHLAAGCMLAAASRGVNRTVFLAGINQMANDLQQARIISGMIGDDDEISD